IYGVTPFAHANPFQIFQHLSESNCDFSPYLYYKEGSQAVRHLFSVAGGLDSMVLGETEITGQVKQAYQAAHEAKLTGRFLNRIFQTALQVAKAIRTRTAVGRGATSVGSVAVELAGRIFDQDLSQKTVMIIGAGKMGEACVRHLSKRGARSVLVSNRSFERARALAAEFGGRAIRLDDCLDAMVEADIVVSSTGSPATILHRADIAGVMERRGHRPLVLIDIAVPRDIAADVQDLANVYLYDVDDLEVIVRENLRLREQELARCEELIEKHVNDIAGRLFGKSPSAPARVPAMAILEPAVCGG
ncbi:MAG TPA: glutamyl-tRNA reductase, partial [Verrucomicrobia bacterium]|nr:glutamyl-tRNA reductase [Verrucomicrobiota bacterium]